MQEEARRAQAALVLAAALLGFALARGRVPAADCPAPRELRAQEGHTRELLCTGAGGRPVRGPARRLMGLPLDPNTADAATLETLPRIGPGRARAILAARPFACVEELERVPGIGPRTLAELAPLLAVAPLGRPGGDPVVCKGTQAEKSPGEAP